uniref:Uncharacterized protein n=1 Tax=Anguilla anguilla TaxID=7936 RepID=A0A0E9T7E7_ANGAN
MDYIDGGLWWTWQCINNLQGQMLDIGEVEWEKAFF